MVAASSARMPSMRASRTSKAAARDSLAFSRAARCASCRRSHFARSLTRAAESVATRRAASAAACAAGQRGGGLAGRVARLSRLRARLLALRRRRPDRGELGLEPGGAGAGGRRVLVLVGRLLRDLA